MLTGRALSGICEGIYIVVCPIYCSEVSPPSLRGRFGGIYTLSV